MSHAEILPTHTPALFNAAVDRAVDALRRGEIVALPTETVYGLAANALDENAVRRIFEAKGRPAHNPIIVHVSSLDMARTCAAHWPAVADQLSAAFWPGPITLVLPRAEKIPDVVTAGGGTVGLRWPGHPIMQAVIARCGFPLAAPSANRSNEISPTNAAHVNRSLGTRVGLILDGGQSQVGIESTVLDISVMPPRLLRPGMIHGESLLAVVGILAADPQETGATLKSPGLLRKHYAPKARLRMVQWNSSEDFTREVAALQARLRIRPDLTRVITHSHVPRDSGGAEVSVIPHDAEAFARAIYAELHRCDESGAELIVVEALPDVPEWRAIRDRLQRAAAEDA